MIDYITIGLIDIIALASPGPDFALVVKNSLAYSKIVAVYTMLGIVLGASIHMTYCILGLAVVISQSLLLFNSIKIIGGCYLITIGIKALFSSAEAIAMPGKLKLRQMGHWQGFRQGLFCNLLNPKASLFFLGLFTLVIKPQTPWLRQISYGLEIMVITLLWFTLLITIITQPAVRRYINPVQDKLTKLMGVLFVMFGVKLICMH